MYPLGTISVIFWGDDVADENLVEDVVFFKVGTSKNEDVDVLESLNRCLQHFCVNRTNAESQCR